ncbi:Hsp33 family molecular chaperone HslO [Lentilactobacillus farraginis]|uniref:33 kDa chaperonin n=1 Tax=Lentilactobacillus farraginis DSM 18382 = JCM 14108 TaxID=1423743 RepID=X0QCP1_9LACO|nr:Hsp33 family molecular chaperone HslO [Lentilactobacillus farraginis]KRM09631.1 heat shock protein HSP33 [Lentilactobacillus farraginis DSM 18382 = JCM 14108]GAF36385.1 chaperonin [Lentilactobacillus farraginis DSM 18382 = JCM 14108]
MKDYLVKATTTDGMFRAYAVDAKETISTAQKDHDTWSASSAALGRTLIGSLMLAASVDKSGEAITVKINGQGPVGGIVVDSDSKGHVKGYIQNPHVHLPLNKKHKIDVSKAVGVNGFLEVTRVSANEDPYTSSVPLASGEIGDDFTFYLAQSEQIPSAVGVSVFVNDDNSIGAAGGYLIQTLPGASDDAITKVINRIKEMPMISELLLDHQTPEEMLELIFGKNNLHFLDKMPVEFYCNCSKQKFAQDLAGISVDQLETMLKEDRGVSVTCNFCQSKYRYNEEELRAIIAAAKQKKASSK